MSNNLLSLQSVIHTSGYTCIKIPFVFITCIIVKLHHAMWEREYAACPLLADAYEMVWQAMDFRNDCNWYWVFCVTYHMLTISIILSPKPSSYVLGLASVTFSIPIINYLSPSPSPLLHLHRIICSKTLNFALWDVIVFTQPSFILCLSVVILILSFMVYRQTKFIETDYRTKSLLTLW